MVATAVRRSLGEDLVEVAGHDHGRRGTQPVFECHQIVGLLSAATVAGNRDALRIDIVAL